RLAVRRRPYQRARDRRDVLRPVARSAGLPGNQVSPDPVARGRTAASRRGELDRTVPRQSSCARPSYVFEVGQVGGAGEFLFVVWLLIFGVRATGAGARDSAVSVPARNR